MFTWHEQAATALPRQQKQIVTRRIVQLLTKTVAPHLHIHVQGAGAANKQLTLVGKHSLEIRPTKSHAYTICTYV